MRHRAPGPPVVGYSDAADAVDDPTGSFEAVGAAREEARPSDPSDPSAPGSPGTAESSAAEQRSILSSSAVMAAGTVVSRLSGFVRSALLAAALGIQLHGEIFTVANTIPNMLYILLAGGVFNAVLVPQLVRSMKHDPDGGEAYANRVVTLALLFLGAVTLLLVAVAPWVMAIYLPDSWPPEARDSAIDFARYCLPQVFFYGMFVLVGQILNARGRFGPMMWAPIANNVIAVAVLVVYLVVFGAASGAEVVGPFSPSQELLLGLGSTLGIAAQLLILVPYLRSAGFRFRPRFDFRGTGLGHTLRLARWTVAFVIVNQVAYTVVVRLAGTGVADGSADGTGNAVYASAFLIVMVPHSIITVSLATAILPRLSQRAADGDLAGLGRSLGATLRTSLAVLLPFAALLPVVAPEVARVVWGYAAASQSWPNAVPTLALFGPGIVLFTVHYLMLRGFYALEATRTVFWIQCGVAATNIGAAVVLVALTDAAATSAALATAYAAAYLVGTALSYSVLERRTGDLGGRTTSRFLVRLGLVVALSTGLAYAVSALLGDLPLDAAVLPTLARGVGVTLVDVVAFLALARVFRLTEVTDVLATVTGRLGRR
ncbi:murein biosynthesis integral membrane protein MurJ [Nocardioides kribbensis]|uniref:murein biosynthesis integral membrane protein MurJ n=1 Tax=Nocardioides kribbensis TaxID=305517 RepID=UPI001D0CF4F1|nr:murein biosynthesis integral membrane protein MurJ [Nocardioides kribbensis]